MQTRQTKYSIAIKLALQTASHATNAELLETLRNEYPDLSATTVHRVTSRLHDQGVIATAPADTDGSMRYDITTTPHDHFICTNCGGIRDLDVADAIIPRISEALGGCKITGRLLIHGSCEKCMAHINNTK